MIMYRNPVVRRYRNPIDSLRADLGAQPTRGAPNEGGRARCQRVRRLLRLPEAQWKAAIDYHGGRRSNHWDIYDLVTFTAAHAARCTTRHGVGSHAEPPTTECAIPTGKKFARQSRAA
jgi:hypothetical protein